VSIRSALDRSTQIDVVVESETASRTVESNSSVADVSCDPFNSIVPLSSWRVYLEEEFKVRIPF